MCIQFKWLCIFKLPRKINNFVHLKIFFPAAFRLQCLNVELNPHQKRKLAKTIFLAQTLFLMNNGSLKLNIFVRYYNIVLWIIEIKILIECIHLSFQPLFIFSHQFF